MPFPKNFNSIAKTILKRLFRVYAHIYHQHFQQVIQLQEEAHLNTSFKHFIFFIQEFGLVEKKELAPLHDLIDKLTGKDRWNWYWICDINIVRYIQCMYNFDEQKGTLISNVVCFIITFVLPCFEFVTVYKLTDTSLCLNLRLCCFFCNKI